MFSFTGDEQRTLLRMAGSLKKYYSNSRFVPYQPLIGKTMSMIFQKRSTRTRVSAEGGFCQLGGHAIFLGGFFWSHFFELLNKKNSVYITLIPHAHLFFSTGSEDVQLGKNETLRDTATVLGRFNDLVLARVYGHGDIEELSRYCDKPIINALSDLHHPLQQLADMQTLEEEYGSLSGLTLAWVGDGNNILNTILSSAGPLGYNVQYATPPGYEPHAKLLQASQALAKTAGVRLQGFHNPLEAVKGADVIVTDTWVSMGQEVEAKKRLEAFKGYQVTEELGRRGGAKPGWIFLHCLPRKLQEVDDDVFYGPRTRVWAESENRKWTFMAVALAQLQGGLHLS